MMTERSSRKVSPALIGGAVGALLALAAWQVIAPRVVLAQVPDSGAQRNEMIRELQESTKQLRDANKELGTISERLREIRDLQKQALRAAPRDDERPARP